MRRRRKRYVDHTRPMTMTNAAAISIPAPTILSQWLTSSSIVRLADTSRMTRALRSILHAQASGENPSQSQRQTDTGNAGRPAKAIEHLAQHCATDESTKEVGGEIDAARRAAVDGGGAADKAGCD